MTNLAPISCTPPELMYICCLLHTTPQCSTIAYFQWHNEMEATRKVIINCSWERFIFKILCRQAHLQQRRSTRKSCLIFTTQNNATSVTKQVPQKVIEQQGWRTRHDAWSLFPVTLIFSNGILPRRISWTRSLSHGKANRCLSVCLCSLQSKFTETVSVYLSAGCTARHVMPCHHASIAPMRKVAENRSDTVPKLRLVVWHLPTTTKSDLVHWLRL